VPLIEDSLFWRTFEYAPTFVADEAAALRREWFAWTWVAIGHVAAARVEADISWQVMGRAKTLYETMREAAYFSPAVLLAWGELGSALEAQ